MEKGKKVGALNQDVLIVLAKGLAIQYVKQAAEITTWGPQGTPFDGYVELVFELQENWSSQLSPSFVEELAAALESEANPRCPEAMKERLSELVTMLRARDVERNKLGDGTLSSTDDVSP